MPREGVYIARGRNRPLKNPRLKNTGRSTFNVQDHGREVVGTCQPFPAKILVTKQKAEGFEEAQAPKQMIFQS